MGKPFWRLCDASTDPIHAVSQPSSNECTDSFIHFIIDFNIWAQEVVKTDYGLVQRRCPGPWMPVGGGWRALRGRLTREVWQGLGWAMFPLWAQDASSGNRKWHGCLPPPARGRWEGPGGPAVGCEHLRICWRVIKIPSGKAQAGNKG